MNVSSSAALRRVALVMLVLVVPTLVVYGQLGEDSLLSPRRGDPRAAATTRNPPIRTTAPPLNDPAADAETQDNANPQDNASLNPAALLNWGRNALAPNSTANTNPANANGGSTRFPRVTNAADNGQGGFGSTATYPTRPNQTNGGFHANNSTQPGFAGNRPLGGSGRVPVYTADGRGGNRAAGPPREVQVTKGGGALPNNAGQVWREYDISPYTSRIRNRDKPEQAIIDWILRETGTDVWFSQPLGILNADYQTLRVYHTPEMQDLVLEIVERFVLSEADSHTLSVRVMTVSSPTWRSRLLSLMSPVDVKSAGVEAWLLSKENAAVLVAELQRRNDYREINAPNLRVQSGQTETLAQTRPRTFNRSVRATTVYPGYEIVPGQLNEGFVLQLSPLLSLDGRTCDTVVKCDIDQVEKLLPVNLDIPVQGAYQRVQTQTPQLISWRLQERFRFPADQILLLSCGVVANPAGTSETPLTILNPFDSPGRTDALLMIECKGPSDQVLGNVPALAQAGRAYPTSPFQAVPGQSNPLISSNPYSRGRY